jgi:hypothetical protein
MMVWLNGSVLHDPPVKEYECRICLLSVVKYPDGDYKTEPIQREVLQQQ